MKCQYVQEGAVVSVLWIKLKVFTVPAAHKYLQSRILQSGSALWAQMVRGRRWQKADSLTRNNEVYRGVIPRPLPSRPCVQLWSRIMLQWTHQRVDLWSITEVDGQSSLKILLHKFTPHTRTHLWPPSQRPHSLVFFHQGYQSLILDSTNIQLWLFLNFLCLSDS